MSLTCIPFDSLHSVHCIFDIFDMNSYSTVLNLNPPIIILQCLSFASSNIYLLHLYLHLLIIYYFQAQIYPQLEPRFVCIWINLLKYMYIFSIFNIFDMHCVLHTVHYTVHTEINTVKIQLTTRNEFCCSFLFWGSGTPSPTHHLLHLAKLNIQYFVNMYL